MKKIRDVSTSLNLLISPNEDAHPNVKMDDKTKEKLVDVSKSLRVLLEVMEDGKLTFKTKSSFLIYHDDLISLGFMLTSQVRNGDDYTWTFTLK